MVKALALFSGGLDSVLSAKLILELGIETEAVYFLNAFLSGPPDCPQQIRAAAQLGLKLHILDISQAHLELVQKPRYGYGENMNPCIDCRILMLKEAKAYMRSHNFSFLISGEVLGQRPMSQRKDTLNVIDRDADVKGLVLRPLSAKKLAPTFAEEKGWVDRDKLFDFSGRSRKPQLALAKKLGLKEYLTPAGGCLLTEAGFVRRFRDLLAPFQMQEEDDRVFGTGQACGKVSLGDVQLLKVGRHSRYRSKARIVVGRDQQENGRLIDLACDEDILFKLHDFSGPLTLVRGEETVDLIETAAKLTARYSKGKEEEKVRLDYWRGSSEEKKSILVTPAGEKLIEKMRI